MVFKTANIFDLDRLQFRLKTFAVLNTILFILKYNLSILLGVMIHLSNDYKQIFDECFPLKRRSGKNRIRKPWLTNCLLRSIKTKNKLYMQFIRRADPAKERRYKNYKNNLSRLIRVAKRPYYDKKFEENKTNTKQTWKYLNDIINKKKNKPNRINTFLSQDNGEISDPLEIANRFCHFFSNIGSNLAKKIPSTPSWSPESYLANQNNLSSFSLQIRLLMMKL